MTRTLLTLSLASIFAAAGLARAGEAHDHILVLPHSGATDAPSAQADAWKRWAEDYSRDMRASMGTMFGARLGGRTVKGAPYSAEIVTESNQNLADGNVISRKSTGAVYRDGEGRTRQETGGDGKSRVVYISDPVAGKSYVLTPGSKKAIVTSMPKAVVMSHDGSGHKDVQVFRNGKTVVRVEDGKVTIDGKEVTQDPTIVKSASGREIRIENGQVFIDGKPLRTPTPPAPPGAAPSAAPAPAPSTHVRTIETKDADGNVRREEIRVQVVRSGDGPMLAPLPPMPPTAGVPMVAPVPPVPPVPPMPGIQTMRFESTARLGKGVTTQLGTKDFDGVKAEGKSTVWTIPAGEIGNRNAINITSESWYAPDLQVTVYSRYNDPRTGESIYRLANLKRGEPSQDMFAVPEEYALKDRTRR